MPQEQFLDVIDRDEAHRRFLETLDLHPRDVERVSLEDALGRVLAEDVVAAIDVPSFDRSNYDGYAVRAADTYGADEQTPRRSRLLDEVAATGITPQGEVTPGTAMPIATGGMLPRGADAVMMVEYTEEIETEQTDTDTLDRRELVVRRAVTPGFGVSFAGSDIMAGETVLRSAEVLTSRETGVLAALGVTSAMCWRRPRVAILSTGDEIIAPGEPMRPGLVYDSNARILADAVRELGGVPVGLGIVRDDLDALREKLHEGLDKADVVLLSGGTSKGAGDLSYRVVRELSRPGIVAHGVALKPGKPICLAAESGKPVVILPGFPTSAIFTFHEFVAPVIRTLTGRPARRHTSVDANLAVKINSQIGRTEYVLVGLVGEPDQLAAYPMGKGSGSVTTFSRADGFVTIERHEEIVESSTPVRVQLLGGDLRAADLVVIGSHCVGLDFLLGRMAAGGFCVKFMAVGSTGGLEAARRGECDLAGIHLLDPESGQYNVHLVDERIELVEGYGRRQGVLFRPGDSRFESEVVSASALIDQVKDDATCVMVNRNQGSGTRILIDRLLAGTRPNGYAVQAKSHNAVAASIKQGRADWGVAIESVANRAALGFVPLEDERYDFVVPSGRLARPAVLAFRQLLNEEETRQKLAAMGFNMDRRLQNT